MRALLLSLVAVVLFSSCDPRIEGVEDDAGALSGAGGGSAMTGGGTGATGGGLGTDVTFCDVQRVLQTKCANCHAAATPSGAPVLVTSADLRAPSSFGGTQLDRCIARLSTTPVSNAMPPGIGGTADDIQLFIDWRANGMPECAGVDGGTGGGAGGGGGGNVMTTCAGTTWAFGNNLGVRMNPGEACQSCHSSRRRGPIAGFMGTVYPSLHEAQLCTVTNVPSGLKVEILDSSGVVRQSFAISALNDGNFYGGTVGVPSPYTARVVVNGVVTSQMLTPQTNGDCNSCHTALGAQGAPGRIHW